MMQGNQNEQTSLNKKTNKLSKRLRATCIISAICVTLCVALGVLVWLQTKDATVENDKTLVEMLPVIEFKDVERIDVKNKLGEYSLVSATVGENSTIMVIEGNETAPLDMYRTQMLLSNVCQTYYTFSADVTEADYEKYGLANGAHQAEFKVATKNGVSYTVYIGDETLANDGYYVRVPDKDAIFVLGYSIEKDLLGTSEYLIDKSLIYPTDMNRYFLVNSFMLSKNGEPFVAVEFLDTENRDEFNIMGIHRFLYPKGYFGSGLYTGILTKFSATDAVTGASNFMATEVYSYDVDLNTLAKYGINPYKAPYQLSFGTPIMANDDTVANYIPNLLYFSEKQTDEDGAEFYYVYSASKGILGRIEQITVDFFEWGLDKWVSSNLFQVNIMAVDRISFESEKGKYDFKLSGATNDVLTVTELGSGYSPEIGNFRNLWQSMFVMTHDGYADLTDAEKEYLVNSEENKLLTIDILTRNGNTRKLEFYLYTDRRVFYTVNGVGEFYLPVSIVEKVIADVERFMDGEIIDPEAGF
ncbi:MAG: DUF4340 domain-containing protein [Clostridia bacterium]|nr:DUF4340 domain-containing protein [Clostridia bacterium]